MNMNKSKIEVKAEKMAERTGLEPATPCVTGRYSNQLNYRSVKWCVLYDTFQKILAFFEKKLKFS